jgi:hypothetical protein
MRPITDPKFKRWVRAWLSHFAFVRWDRFVYYRDEHGKAIEVYGWITRKDAKSDFAILYLYENRQIVDYMTSSKKYSKLFFTEITHRKTAHGHQRCKRVEDFFPVRNAIRLKAARRANTIALNRSAVRANEITSGQLGQHFMPGRAS